MIYIIKEHVFIVLKDAWPMDIQGSNPEHNAWATTTNTDEYGNEIN